MRENRMQLELLGFEPDYNLRSAIDEIANDIRLSSPSDAITNICIKKSTWIFFASLKIVSKAGVFTAHATDHDALSVMKKLAAKIDLKLSQWKRTRFINHKNNKTENYSMEA